jgi:hypothetical protein
VAVDDAGRGREQRGRAFQCWLQGAGLVARERAQVIDAVGGRGCSNVVEPFALGFIGGDDQLAATPVRDAALRTVVKEQGAAGDAEASLERARRVVDAGVDHLAVAGTDAGAEGVFGFEDQHLAALRGQRTGDGEADHTGADHGAFDFFHGLVAEFAQRLHRQG